MEIVNFRFPRHDIRHPLSVPGGASLSPPRAAFQTTCSPRHSLIAILRRPCSINTATWRGGMFWSDSGSFYSGGATAVGGPTTGGGSYDHDPKQDIYDEPLCVDRISRDAVRRGRPSGDEN